MFIGGLAVLFTGCDNFVLWDLFEGESTGSVDTELAISPTASSTLVGQAVLFSASGGTPPYSYTLVSGAGVIDDKTGRYTAPNEPSVDIVRVYDDTGQSVDAQVVVTE